VTTVSTNETATVVRRGYAAFHAADVVALSELFAEDASWHTPGLSPIAGHYQGRDAVLAQLGRYRDETDGTFRAELIEVFTSEDRRVVGLHRNRAERNGKRLDTDCCVVFDVEDGRVRCGREHFFDLGNWDDFWS
jgi:uncharacterized protein